MPSTWYWFGKYGSCKSGVSGFFLHGVREPLKSGSVLEGPESPRCGTMKVKPGLQWRPQDAGNARTVRHLLRRDAYMELCRSKSETYIADVRNNFICFFLSKLVLILVFIVCFPIRVCHPIKFTLIY